MFGFLTKFIPPQFKAIVIGIVIASILGAGGLIWYQSSKITKLNITKGTLSKQVEQLNTVVIEQVTEFNEKFTQLQKNVEKERQYNQQLVNEINRYNEDLKTVKQESEKTKRKYESERLTKLSQLKGGLLTEKAKTAAKERNEEWENTVNSINSN